MTELQPPGFLGDATVAHGPDNFRQMNAMLGGNRWGVIEQGDLQVTTTGTGPLAIRIAAGAALIPGDDRPPAQGYYHVVNDASVTKLLTAADTTQNRRDLVIARILDDTEDSGGSNLWEVAIIAGTLTASTNPTAPAVPDNAIELAQVYIPANGNVVQAANIIDRRRPSGIGVSNKRTAFRGDVINPSTLTVPTGADVNAIPEISDMLVGQYVDITFGSQVVVSGSGTLMMVFQYKRANAGAWAAPMIGGYNGSSILQTSSSGLMGMTRRFEIPPVSGAPSSSMCSFRLAYSKSSGISPLLYSTYLEVEAV